MNELLLIVIFLIVVGALIAREVHERKRDGDPPIFVAEAFLTPL